MRRAAVSILACLLAGQAAAQDAAAPSADEPTIIANPMSAYSFSSKEAETAAGMLIGTWRSDKPINDGSGSHIVMSIAPVTVEGLADTMYAEVARSEDPSMPYRQVLLQLYQFEDTLRLRTLEFKNDGIKAVLVGTAYVPDRFPSTITPADLYATLDVDLEPSGSGYEGSTPYPYPTTESDAVQMTSGVRMNGNTLTTFDTGFGTDGSVVWGGPDGSVSFARADDLVQVERWSDGFIKIQFAEGEGDPVRDGDSLAVHYTGRLTDGTKFDSSRDRGQPFRYEVPGRLISGWLRGTEDIREGAQLRLIIPPELGYGPQANARIPGNSTLVFDIECVGIDRPDPAPAGEEAQEASPEGE